MLPPAATIFPSRWPHVEPLPYSCLRGLSSAAGLVAGDIASEMLAGTALATDRRGKNSGADGIRGGHILLKGSCVLSPDPNVGDLEQADVLIEGSRIVAIQPNLKATAEVIDAANMIAMPGFVDTHRHIWEGPLRNILPNGLLSSRETISCPRPAGREAALVVTYQAIERGTASAAPAAGERRGFHRRGGKSGESIQFWGRVCSLCQTIFILWLR